jgi:hypothetical protein
MRVAPAFQFVMMPFRDSPRIASSDDSTIAASHVAASIPIAGLGDSAVGGGSMELGALSFMDSLDVPCVPSILLLALNATICLGKSSSPFGRFIFRLNWASWVQNGPAHNRSCYSGLASSSFIVSMARAECEMAPPARISAATQIASMISCPLAPFNFARLVWLRMQ